MAHAKALLILIGVSLGYPSYLARIRGFESFAPAGFYVALFLLLLALVLLTAQIRLRLLRYALAVCIAVSFAAFDAYFRVMGEPLLYTSFVTLLNSRHFAGAALAQFGPQLEGSVIKGLILLIGIGMKPRGRMPQLLPVLSSFAGVAILAGILFARGGHGVSGLHGSYVLPAYLGLYLYELVNNDVGERNPVQMSATGVPAARDIVFIIDESIRGDYLDINSEYGIDSGLTSLAGRAQVLNYGLAASITNCSHETNVTLRYGGTREDYWRINNTMPSIWQYAKAAGFRTVYVDAQLTGGRVQNGMDTNGEFDDIDSFVQFDGVPVSDRDMLAARMLTRLLGNDQREFILVNKIGAHFPVHDKYPDNYMHFKPVLVRGRYEGISDTGDRDGFEGSETDWALYRNSYRNTLLWNVGGFFERLGSAAGIDDAIVVYTADHGQELHEDGHSGGHTHCRQETASMEEGVVPLVLVKGRRSVVPEELLSNLRSNHNGSSHYNIFPTLLILMGYDRKQVTEIYGLSLVDETNDPLTFNVRFDLRLGAEPVWKRVRPEAIKRPDDGETHRMRMHEGEGM